MKNILESFSAVPETVNEDVRKNVEIILNQEKKPRPETSDFIDNTKAGYKEEDVRRDEKMVERMEEIFENNDGKFLKEKERKIVDERKKFSEVVEMIIVDWGDELKWFGPNAKLIRTSRYDDIANGVDGVAEFETEEGTQRIALAVDASISLNPSIIKRKMDKNIEKILDEKKRSKIKYFKSEIDDHKGELNFVVPVVVGIDANNSKNIINVLSEIAKKQSGEDNMSDEELYDKIQDAQKEPCQIIFLKEIKEQLVYYLELLKEKKSEKSDHYKEEIKKLLDVVSDIIDSKNNIQEGDLSRDGVYLAIKDCINN